MWTHPYYLGQPLTLTFSLPPHMATDNPLKAVSKIRLWNYNKNIHVCIEQALHPICLQL